MNQEFRAFCGAINSLKILKSLGKMEIGGFKVGVMEMQILGVDDGVKRPTEAAIQAKKALDVRMARYRASSSQGAPLAAVSGATGQRSLGDRLDTLGVQAEVTKTMLTRLKTRIEADRLAKEDAEDENWADDLVAMVQPPDGRSGTSGGAARVIPFPQRPEDPGIDEDDEVWVSRMLTKADQGPGVDDSGDLSLSQAPAGDHGEDSQWVNGMLQHVQNN
jgi:hypothetical protein